DGIQPSNEGRGYVLRRILRRAVRYGRTLGFHEPFFYKLADVLATTMGDVFPEIRAKKKHVQQVIRTEEEAFNKTLDNGIKRFNKLMEEQRARGRAAQKREVISLSQIETTTPTKFVGYEKLETPAKVLEIVSLKDKTAVVLDTSACYAEMGGQVGDTGEIRIAA